MIPPRARTTGELLESIVAIYRERFLLFTGIVALPEIGLVVLRLIIRLATPDLVHLPDLTSDPLRALSIVAGSLATSALLLVAGTVAYAAAGGASILAVAAVSAGERSLGVGWAYGKLGSRASGAIGVCLVVLALFGLGFTMSAALAFLAGALAGMIAPLLGGLVIVVLLLPGILAPALWLLRYMVALPVLVLEGTGVRGALGRSESLTRGSRGRVLLVLLLMLLIGVIASFVLEGPFLIVGLLVSGGGQAPFWVQVPATLAGGLAGVLGAPFLMIGQAVLYMDLRGREKPQG